LPDPADQGRAGWTVGRVVTFVLFLCIVGFWVWAFSPLAPSGHPDRLDAETFAQASEPLCAAALADVTATVPLATDAPDIFTRADDIRTATDIYLDMVDDLTAIAPAAGTRDGDLVRAWLTDWRTFLDDRYAQADRFANGIDEAFVVTVRGGRQVTSAIDVFADVNDMPSCVAALDV